ncbi:hypothetical protein FOA52_005694 [Chlamydomonas sp. UWO 241]|nr:hypothetical protein FOA52_005694 [Chlamydomonas sp. UWO 241]
MALLAVLAALGWTQVVIAQGIYATPVYLPKAPNGAWLPVVQVTDFTYQPGCDVPTTQAPNFSSAQIARLAEKMESALTPDCFLALSTSLVICMPDLSMQTGCCTPLCDKALTLVMPAGCVQQAVNFTCQVPQHISDRILGMINRCLGNVFRELDPSFSGISCPPLNASRWQAFARAQWGIEPNTPTQGAVAVGEGNQTLQVSTAASKAALGSGAPANATASTWDLRKDVTAEGSDILAGYVDTSTMPKGDKEYYEACTSEPVTVWPEFNVSRALDLVLVLAREAPQDCLRSGMTYLPLCYGDLRMESGCCSLQCRAALQKAFNSTTRILAGTGGLYERPDIPRIATEEGEWGQTEVPGYVTLVTD